MSVGVLKDNLVYVLQLQNFRYFVGELNIKVNLPLKIKNYEQIIKEETNKIEMVRMNSPFLIIQVLANADVDECTIYFMRKYGWKNVRGGKWNEVVLLKPPEQLQPPINMEIDNVFIGDVKTSPVLPPPVSEYKLTRTTSSKDLYRNINLGSPTNYTVSYDRPLESYWNYF